MTASLAPTRARSVALTTLLAAVLVVVGLGVSAPARAATPPPVPGNVRATAVSTSTIDLTWDASPGATSYRILVSDTSTAGPYAYLIRTAATSYSHTGLGEGATRHYKVRADGDHGSSEYSAPASATTLVRPDPPTGLAAQATGKRSVRIEWMAPAAGPAPDRYYVYRSTVAGGPYDRIGSTNLTVFDDAGLTQGPTYRYVVRSHTAAGKSGPSAEAAVHLPAPPTAPTDLAAAPVSRTQIRLSWVADPSADRFEVSRSPSSGGPFTIVGIVREVEFLDAGLAENSTHHYRVTARNVGGRSAPAGPVAATTFARPGVPTGLVAEFVPRRNVDLRWNAVPGATSYEVYRAPDPSGPFTMVGRVGGTSHRDSPPEIGRFTYHVRAYGTGGRSAPSAPITLLVDRPPDVVDRTFGIQANMPVRVGATGGLLAGVSDRDGPGPLSVRCALVTVPAGGEVECGSDGSFGFQPPAGVAGVDAVAFEFTVCDALGACTSRSARFSLSGPMIWFVDAGAPAGGHGRMGDPFATLADAVAAVGASPDQAIFIDDSAAHPTPVTVRSGVMLAGAGAIVPGGFDDLMGIDPSDDPDGVDTADRPALSRAAPVVEGTVALTGAGGEVRGIHIAPVRGRPGLTGSGAGGVTVGGAQADVSVTTTSAHAVDLDSVTGAIRLGSVTSTGPDAGVLLDGFGGPRFEIRGGTIQSTTGTGLRLIGSQSVVLRDLSVSGNAEHGIHATDVTNLTLIDTTVDGNGSQPAHRGLRVDGAGGSLRLDGGSFTRSAGHNAAVTTGEPLAVTVTGTTFGPRPATGGGNGLLAQAVDGGELDLAVTAATATGNFSDGIQVVATGSGRVAARVSNSSFADNGNAGVNIAAGGTGASTFLVQANALTGSGGNAVNVNLGAGTASLTGGVLDNTVGETATPASGSAGGSGIQVDKTGSGELVVDVMGNRVRHVEAGNGIAISGHDGAGRLDATVAGNDVNLESTGALDGIAVNVGINPSDAVLVCADIHTNESATAGSMAGNGAYDGAGIAATQSVGTSRLALAGYTGGATDDAAVAGFLQARNGDLQGPGGAVHASHVTGYESGFAACRRPAPPKGGSSHG